MSSVVFQDLRIERLDGLSPPFRMGGLSTGINVIYGANGVGKSRTADALMHALWPSRVREKGERAHLIAQLLIGGDTWRIEIDNDQVIQRRNSDPADSSPPVPSPAICSRYRLSLHELLAAEDSDLASAILKESIGGYDLKSAFAGLGIEKPSRRAPKEQAALREAAQAVFQATAEQSKLAARESRLNELRIERGASQAAQQRAELIDAALRLHELRDIHRAHVERLHDFHPVFQRLSGSEIQQLKQLRGVLLQTDNDIARQTRKRDESLAQMKSIDAEINVADAALINALRERLTSLRELARRQQDLRQQLAEHVRLAEAHRKWLDSRASEEELMAIGPPALEQVVQWARAVEQNTAALSAIEQAKSLIAASGPTPNLDVINEGLRLSLQWLQQADAEPATHRSAWVLAGIGSIALLAILLATLVHWPWLFSGVLALCLVPLLTRQKRIDARPEIQRKYGALPLAPPDRWDRASLEALQFSLSTQRAEATLESLKSVRREDLKRQEQSVVTRGAGLDAQRAVLTQRLGIEPKIDPDLLLVFVTHLLQWREAQSKTLASRAGLTVVSDDYERIWTAAMTAIAPLQQNPQDLPELIAVVDNLESLVDRRMVASRSVEEATSELAGVLIPRRANNENQIRAFFEHLQIAPDDESRLAEWLESLPAYKSAAEAAAISNANLRASDAAVAGEGAELPGDRNALLELHARLKSQGDRLEAIDREIATIEVTAQNFANGSTLQNALARQRDAADALREHRDSNCEMGVAYFLAEQLRAQMRDRNRPPVFRRAQQLFERLTLGRFCLDFNDAEPPAFTARNTATNQILNLDQLSSGTRLQLLISVRLAFVQEQEQGISAPLFLDETLGNTDDERAAAVIQSIIEIAREGRQIFYFTAQPDEAAKWRDGLQSSGIAHRMIDLAAVRNLDAAERTPLQQIAPAMKPRVPSSEGLDRFEYGRVLGVPGLRPDLEQVGAIHLWHLLDDMRLLERLLNLGVRDWGAWQTLHRHGAQWVDATAFTRAAARAKLIATLAADRQIGRGRRVDRNALQEDCNVSDTFLDPVAALAGELDGNAVELIARLYDRSVRGFGKARVDLLEASLEQHGYIDRRDRLSTEQLRIRALAALGGELQSEALADDDIDRYLPAFADVTSPLPAGSEPL